MSFDNLNAEVDLQVLSLRRHRFECWWTHFGGRWRWVTGCADCGIRYAWYRQRQICLGVLGELLLVGERVPARWAHHFADRVRVARPTRNKKQRH